MSSISISTQDASAVFAPLRTGVALAVTVAMFYVLCTLVWLAAPGPFLSFMNGLFHGIDFSPLMRPAPFAWGGFVEAVVVMALWAFLAGTFFAWLRQRLGG
ncbi:DUF5676 family membrane protein [Variovorax soli]|uniref:Uncharacterized protein n=1 Tax=Variovorax soli TaxID=376815 RepID=A0ABU1N9P7_9BURK|nr:DUF5676 family membrane protein [Variovorax soli]MDR6534631.1 hypothetical protein [Variovorax soli]